MERVDVVVVGAGLSGIGTAAHLARALPDVSFTILEARDTLGGTWDLFRYPGIRSDSDVLTYGFGFKPWRSDETLASAAKILDYLRETVDEYDLGDRIRLGHRVVGASWSSAEARWHVRAVRTDPATGEQEGVEISAGWLFGATGYFRYDRAHAPEFPGSEDFGGRIVHPQFWPEDLDYEGRRVVVIGSGATAVTLVPAMAERAGQVTMLQRSPSYVLPLPSHDKVGALIRRVVPDEERAYALVRRRNITQASALYKLCQRYPRQARRLLRRVNAGLLPEGYDVDTHFNPTYDPWDQRMCIVPDGDLFRAIRSGAASVVTGTIDRFVPEGVRLATGEVLPADIIVTATGLELLVFGDVALDVDGEPVDVTRRLAYKGAMLSDLPNFAFAIGYTNASWTLKVDLVADFFVRVLAEMRRWGCDTAVPYLGELPEQTRPLLDFGAGYVQRSLDRLPRAGMSEPWGLPMDYRDDVRMLREEPISDGVLRLTRREARIPG